MNEAPDLFQLLKSDIYAQPKMLCGFSCLLAARDLITEEFCGTNYDWLERFRNLKNVPNLGDAKKCIQYLQGVHSSKATTLKVLEKNLEGLEGIRGEITELSKFDWNECSVKKVLLLKTAWIWNGRVGLSRGRPSQCISPLSPTEERLEPEFEHYLLVYSNSENNCLCWEPSFSGPDKSPLLKTTREILLAGNQHVHEYKDAQERGFGIFLQGQ